MSVDVLRKYGEEYFNYLKYSENGRLIKSHVLESLKWGSKVLNFDLLNGDEKSALDVGCAFGYGVELLTSLGYDALGTDISVYGIRQAKRNLSNDFIVCDVQRNLPFKKRFDLIICFEVLEHLRNPLRALQSMCDACNNVILCTTPNKTIERIVKRILRNFDKTHINVKTPQEWEKQIRRTLECRFVKIECFIDVSFQSGDKLFFKSLKLPFGMDTRILIKK